MEEEYNNDVPNIGFSLGDKPKCKSAVSKDLNPETFWSIYEDLLVITKCKQFMSKHSTCKYMIIMLSKYFHENILVA